MPIVAKENKREFTPAPEGLHSAVCVDVVDLGDQPTQWGPKPSVEFRWTLEVMSESGEKQLDPKTKKPFMVTRRFGLSLSEKSRLRPFLESWRGRKFTKDELKGFDLENVLGANCQLQIVHNITDQDTYANVQAVVPAARGVVKMAVPADYIRVCEREKRKQMEQHPDGDDPFSAQEDKSDWVPF